MYCKWCGKELEDDVKFCPTCGYEVNRIEEVKNESQTQFVENNYLNKAEKKKSKIDDYATQGFILSLVAFVLLWSAFGLAIGVASLITSIIGLKSTRKRGYAIAGLIISSIAIALFLFFISALVIF